MSHPNRVNTRHGTTRRSRLLGYDYCTPGYYFVTICTHNRNHYFGGITKNQMDLTRPGLMVSRTVSDCEHQFRTVSIDTYVVMPNHIHVLIGIAVRLSDEPNSTSLIDVIHWLKSTTHQRFREGIAKYGWQRYDGAIWQEGYHDHIVRNDRELEEIRTYVSTNVERWDKDVFHDGSID